jgi:hypothetical protein
MFIQNNSGLQFKFGIMNTIALKNSIRSDSDDDFQITEFPSKVMPDYKNVTDN